MTYSALIATFEFIGDGGEYTTESAVVPENMTSSPEGLACMFESCRSAIIVCPDSDLWNEERDMDTWESFTLIGMEKTDAWLIEGIIERSNSLSGNDPSKPEQAAPVVSPNKEETP